MNEDMIYHIFKEAPKTRNMEIIKFLKEYKVFLPICARHPHGEKQSGVQGDPIRSSETKEIQ